jgi:hypothetical protein
MKVGDNLRDKETGKLYPIYKIEGHFVYVEPESTKCIYVADTDKLFEVIPKEEAE